MEYQAAFRCAVCFFKCQQESLIASHLAQGKHLKFKCKYCQKAFPSLYTTITHQRSVHSDLEACYEIASSDEKNTKDQEVYVCSRCVFSTKCTEAMKQHQGDQHNLFGDGVQYYITSITNILKVNRPKTEVEKKFSSKPDDVSASHMDINFSYKCSGCENWFDKLVDLKQHASEVHNINEPALQVAYNPRGVLLNESALTQYVCIYCESINYTFSEAKDHFKTHGINHHPFQYVYAKPLQEPCLLEEATFKCTLCEFQPEVMDIIKAHWEKEHKDNIFKITRLYSKVPKREHKCDHCINVYPYIMMKKIHMRVFHKNHTEGIMIPPVKKPKLEMPSSSKENQETTLPVITNVFSLNGVIDNPIATEQPVVTIPLPPQLTNVDAASIKEDKYQCFYCTKSYKLYERLQQHHQKEHNTYSWFYLLNKCLDNGTYELLSSDDKIYRCSYCLENFGKNFTAFSLHYKDKHTPLPIKYSIQDGSDGFKTWKPFKHVSGS